MMAYRATLSFISFFCTALLLTQLTYADEKPDILYSSAAVPIETIPPLYPKSAAQRGQEGWVLLHFTIEPDGSVSNPEIIDRSVKKVFDNSALNAVKKWKFEPATKDGISIRTCNKQYKLTYRLQGPVGARRTFIKKYKKIQESVKNASYQEALTKSDKLLEKEGLNLYEAANVHLIRADILRNLGDDYAAMNSLRRALTQDADFINKKIRTAAYLNLMAFQLQFDLYQDAYATYIKSQSIKGAPEPNPAVKNAVQGLEKILNGDQPMSVAGQLEESDSSQGSPATWHYSLFRNGIGFDQSKGKIDKIRLACDTNQMETAFNTEWKYTIPEDWGACKVFVYGEPGASFRLLQYSS